MRRTGVRSSEHTPNPRIAFLYKNSVNLPAAAIVNVTVSWHATTHHTPRMPPAKKAKKSASAPAKATTKATAKRSANEELDGENEFATLARQHWLKSSRRTTKVTVKNDVLKREIWDPLEKDGFPLKSLLALEGLQTLERYAYPIAVDSLPKTLCEPNS